MKKYFKKIKETIINIIRSIFEFFGFYCNSDKNSDYDCKYDKTYYFDSNI